MARRDLTAAYDSLARSLARRFAGRGEPDDDLVQVARVGLLLALDRFDAGRGSRFATFATATIVGELRRHFRDRARWRLRVPRSLQERFLVVSQSVDDLTVELGSSPTVAAIAERCGLSDAQVLEAIEVRHAQSPASLHAPAGEDATRTPGDLIGGDDPAMATVEARRLVASLTGGLTARQRTLLHLRFVDGRTQREIGAALGVSQMQVSRLLARTLAGLRATALRASRCTGGDQPEGCPPDQGGRSDGHH